MDWLAVCFEVKMSDIQNKRGFVTCGITLVFHSGPTETFTQKKEISEFCRRIMSAWGKWNKIIKGDQRKTVLGV
jgi:hypothetical protein